MTTRPGDDGLTHRLGPHGRQLRRVSRGARRHRGRANPAPHAAMTTRRPLIVAFFTDEEGARFGTDMLGSRRRHRARCRWSEAYALTDRARASACATRSTAIGFLGEADEKLAPPHAYLECHIEQGPILRARGVEIGVVDRGASHLAGTSSPSSASRRTPAPRRWTCGPTPASPRRASTCGCAR